MGDIGDAGARLLGVEVVMTHDQGLGVTPVQFLEQPSHGSLLRLGARVGGLTADVQPALVADAYRVGIVVLAVGTRQPFRTTGLYRSVTADHVVVADAEVKASLAMPRVNLSGRGCLVGHHCRTVDDDQCNGSHFGMKLTTTNGSQRGQEGRECGYYYLHRNLKKLLLHSVFYCHTDLHRSSLIFIPPEFSS